MIDMATFTSTAIRDLADRKETLEKERDASAANARKTAEPMTKGQIADLLRAEVTQGRIRGVNLTGRETKPELLDVVTVAYGKASDAGCELDRLTRAAHADRIMARKVNDMIEHVELTRAKLTPDTSDALMVGALRDAYAVKWNADTFMVAVEMGRYAARVAKAVADGHDIRKVSVGMVKEALSMVLRFPRHVLTNGLSGALRGDSMYEAAGAQMFISNVAMAYGYLSDGGDDLVINIGHLNN